MEKFGKYQLIRKLATGGMAEIYLARHDGLEGFQKLMVVKRILPHLAENEEFVEMFLHEARIAVRLNHPNIVQIFDLGNESGSYFIAMEYIAGDDVRRIWKRADAAGTPIPVPLACRIVIDAASGLDYAHKKTDAGRPLNIIHRDVSPQNILVSYEGAVKVVDFGIAKAADQATVTRSGVLKGKYSYMSPEQATGKEIDQKTDQFALGVVLHELLTGNRLFKRNSEIQTLAAVSECKILPPSAVNPRVPRELDPIVMRALAKDPRQRYPDLLGLQTALEEWLLVNRLPSSTSHLASFMDSLYGDRAERERSVWIPDESSGSRSEARHDGRSGMRRRTGLSRGADNATRPGRVRRGPSISDPREPRDLPEARSELSRRSEYRVTARPPQYEPVDHQPDGTMTGSSVSRLVNRLSARKKAAISVAVAAGIAGVAGVIVLQQPGNSTTARPAIDERGVMPVVPELREGRYAGLYITTEPPGATVLIDARPIEGRTPLTVGELQLGEHQIFVELEGYEAQQQTIRLEKEGEITPVRLELRRFGEGSLDEEAKLAATDTSEAQPPDRRRESKREAQQRKIERKDSRSRRTQTVAAAAPAPTSETGTVLIESDPVAVVWQGTQELGRTPLKLTLPAGTHHLMLVNKELGIEKRISAEVRPDAQTPIRHEWRTGEVQFIVKPWADVYLRRRKLGQTPFPKIRLVEGEHQFLLVNEELQIKKEVTVTVKAGEVTRVNQNLNE